MLLFTVNSIKCFFLFDYLDSKGYAGNIKDFSSSIKKKTVL